MLGIGMNISYILRFTYEAYTSYSYSTRTEQGLVIHNAWLESL